MIYEDTDSGKLTEEEELRNYASWPHPFQDSRIYMHPDPLLRVQSHALNSLKSEEPAEIGGILLGRIIPGESQTSIVITSAEFVRCEGYSYNSSESDSERLIAALTRERPESGLFAVGYFRSDLRDDRVCPTGQDRKFIEQHLRNPNTVFLVIRPFENGVCIAEFFFWKDGQLQEDPSCLEVPLMAPETNQSAPALKASRTDLLNLRERASSVVIDAAKLTAGKCVSIAVLSRSKLQQLFARRSPQPLAAGSLLAILCCIGLLAFQVATRTDRNASQKTASPGAATARPNAGNGSVTGLREVARTLETAGNVAPISVTSVPNSTGTTRPHVVPGFVAPVITRRVNPAVPSKLRRQIQTEQIIKVHVDINELGEVTDAEPISSHGAFANLMGTAVLEAAAQYRFAPARRDGVAVPSDQILTFRMGGIENKR